MTATVAILLIGINIVLLYVLLGMPLGARGIRISRTIALPRQRVWEAVWPLGRDAGWSGEIVGAEDLGEGRIRTRLSWQARDGSPVTHTLAMSDVVPGHGYSATVCDDNTLDHSFWEHYRRDVRLEGEGGETRLHVALRDHYRGAAFFLFRYFALRRELTKLKRWAETGEHKRGGWFEHPVTQFASAGVSTLIFWLAFGLTTTGFMQAFMLTMVIVLHELGHMAAFRMMGHGQVRMIFIPVLGGLAIGGRPYDSHYEIAFSALMGAGFSAFLIPLAYSAHLVAQAQGNAVLAQAALFFGGFCALFNLANLLPIWRFDGGQVLRQLVSGRVALALASFAILAAFLAFAWALGVPREVLVICGVVVALLSLLTRGRGIRPRHALVPISPSERALMLTAMVAIAVIHASGLVWVARALTL